MNYNLFNHVNIDKARTFVPDGLEKDSQKACNAYNEIIRQQGGIDLQLLGLDVYKRQVKKFHDTYNDLPKNDYVDSFVIADCLRFGRINKEVYMGDYRYKALQNLTRARFFAVQNLVKEKQRFMNVLFKKYSTMTQEKVFSDDFSTTALAVYDEFESAEALANMDLHELTDFIIEKGKNRFPDPDAVAKAIQKAARSSYRLPKTVNDSVNPVSYTHLEEKTGM